MGKKKNKKLYTKKLEKEYKEKSPKRIIIISTFAFLLLFLLLIRIAWIDVVDGSKYKEMALRQHTIDTEISPKRGTIYDSTGKALATSASVDTVSINPTAISDNNKEKVAKEFSEIFELDYNSVLEKVNSNTKFQTIAKKVENDKITQLQTWMKENKISQGINIDSDSKRYYPYNNLAANLIGFCGNDNDGRSGIEYKWNDILTGTPGRLTSSKNSKSQEIHDDNQKYIPAENGSDIVLSLDYKLQTIAEKYLKQAVNDNNCKNGGNVIMMDPSTGDILAMATYPDFDLNKPFEPFTDKEISEYSALTTSEEKNEYLNKMWKNKAISDTYEPGSTFKILTAAIGLEEGIVAPDKEGDFYCSGSQQVYDTEIKCWRSYNPHGAQSLRSALQNSCNPAFMQLGARIGTHTLYKYYKAFGLFDKTRIALSGEANSQFHQENEVNPVDLATMSFGQRFTITPIQLITAVSAVANDGVLMQPRLVKQIINTDNGNITNIDPVEVRQVLSKKTANTMKDLLQSVVTNGTGRYAAVPGYSVGGKTGTSEPIYSRSQDGYTASYIAISPVENTKLVVLVTLYGLTGATHQGGQVAGPVVKQILSEALPYLGIPSNNTTQAKVTTDSTIMLPDLTNKNMADAETQLKNAGFRVQTKSATDKSEAIVYGQIPKSGVRLIKDSLVILYDNSGSEIPTAAVPNLKGMTRAQAINSLHSLNLNIQIEGAGKVIAQTPAQDTSLSEGSLVSVTLQEEIKDAH